MVLQRLQLRPVRVRNVKQVQKSLLLCIFIDDIRRNKLLIYVDDIIFGCSTHALVVEFAKTLRKEFEMSMMAVLDLDEDGEVVDQKEYRTCPRASHREAVKRIMRYLNYTLEFAIWYSTPSSICLSGYSDADFAGCRTDRKSASGTCHFLGTSLIAWSSRKQSSVAQ
ncbi:secreted RxLR effector protein 161-like [Oryza sativa Japonica Group]|uniref:secreted RxLR effector protein 161-like n=1 Tax=Oryza sativa subsp. japonica TaxID=39947 RepID=UPI00339C65FA